jgi:hypothetical protein
MRLLADILALLCGVAGWFYLFYSKAAARLASVESARLNAIRVALRRVSGAAMVLLGIALFAGSNSVDEQKAPNVFLAIWISVLLLLATILLLALADVRLTLKLRSGPRRPDRT